MKTLKEVEAIVSNGENPQTLEQWTSSRWQALPPRYENADIEQIDSRISKFLFSEPAKGRGMYIHGDIGTGKTYSAWAVWKIIKANSIQSIMVNVPKLLYDIRESYRSNQKANLDDFIACPVLILDDLGSEKVTEWVEESLYILINTRYEQMRRTFFTSNLNLDAIAERVGDRISSRIFEMCDIIELRGDDKRLKKP